jgi:hypothetical protein
MAWNGGFKSICGITIDAVFCAFAQEQAAMEFEMTDELSPIHTASAKADDEIVIANGI